MPADVRAVVANLTTLSPGERGFLTAFPCGIAPPGTSSLNFDSDDPAGAITVAGVGDEGSLCLYSNARTFLIVDLLGVWVPTPGAAPPTEGEGPIPEVPEDPDPPGGGDADGGVGGSGEDGGAGRGGIGGGCQANGRSSPLALLGIAAALGMMARRRERPIVVVDSGRSGL